MSPNGFQLSVVSEQMGQETLSLCHFVGGDLPESLSEAEDGAGARNLREGEGSQGVKPRGTMWNLPPAAISPPS